MLPGWPSFHTDLISYLMGECALDWSKIWTLILMGGLGLSIAACSPDPVVVENGQPIPSFQSPDFHSVSKSVPSDYSGKVLVIRFWADWCRFCETEMTQIEPVYQRYQEQGLEVLAVNVRQDLGTAQTFMDKLGVTYPGLLDEDGEVARQFGVIGLPTTFVVDREGILRTKIIGESTADVFETVVKKHL